MIFIRAIVYVSECAVLIGRQREIKVSCTTLCFMLADILGIYLDVVIFLVTLCTGVTI